MLRNVWRYSHFALAVSSFLTLTLASLTGILLAFEPVIEKNKGYGIRDSDQVTLAQSVPVLREKFPGIQALSVDEHDFVVIKYADQEGTDRQSYVNPLSGKILGTPQEKKALFQWATTLHRSLFLHETGRLIMGITAFLLLLVTLSGIGLLAQRQKGFRRFFAPVDKGSFAQYYHVVFGRIVLVFILAVALTGTYLSVSRFLIKPKKETAQVKEEDIKEEPERKAAEFPVFQQTRLSAVETIEFPFSEFPEDYFTLKLKDRELKVNQITGDLLAQQVYTKAYTLNNFSLEWHTGRSSSVWAIVLAITAGYTLFFICSGLVISWKRLRGRSKNRYDAADGRIIILVGSENGSTFRFASAVYRQLIKHGEKAYIAGLDQYTVYPKAEHLVIMTSTYGEGDPPSNAWKFLDRLVQEPQQQPVHFSVVGFGSRSYRQFCGFAVDTDQLLRQQPWARPLLNLVMVNDRSPQDFSTWLTAWTQHTGLPLLLPRTLLTAPKDRVAMTVTAKTEPDADEAFLISLAVKQSNRVRSGDLLAIYPKNDHRERLYSIGKVDGAIQLSVKRHAHGLGSQFLQALQTGATIRARIIRNEHFHFPLKAPQVLLVSNGTGIAPFLGMISENRQQTPCYLYCGFRTQSSFDLYEPFLAANKTTRKLTAYHAAFSREEGRQYVSHLLQRDAERVWQFLSAGGVVMICGSLSMQKDVLTVLETICRSNQTGIAAFREKGQVLTDCY